VVESENTYKTHVYDTLRVFEGKKFVSRSLRIINIFPSINWHVMLVNLSLAVASDALRSMWYVVVHDLVPTNVKMHSIHFITTDSCLTFGATYTLIHSLTEYGATVDIWIWTTADFSGMALPSRNQNLAAPKYQTTLWFLCYTVFYVVKIVRSLSALECMDFMRPHVGRFTRAIRG